MRALAACTLLSFVAVTGCAENETADETPETEAPAVATDAPSAVEEVSVPDGTEPSVTEPSAGGAAPGSVAVTITGIRGALGHDMAAVMFDGVGTEDTDTRGIGGFGVEVDADPFSTTQTITTPSSIDFDTQFPHVSQKPLVVEPGEYTIMVWIAEGLSSYSRWVPADSPGLGGCRMDVTVEEGRPTSVIVDGIPSWAGFAPECNSDADGIPVAWEISLDDGGEGVHTVHMVLDFGPTPDAVVEEMSGRLIWDQIEVALCGINIRFFEMEEGRLRVGDIFQTTEGCGDDPTAMQDAFDEFGLPDTACVAASYDGSEQEFCARLPTTRSANSADEGEGPGLADPVLTGQSRRAFEIETVAAGPWRDAIGDVAALPGGGYVVLVQDGGSVLWTRDAPQWREMDPTGQVAGSIPEEWWETWEHVGRSISVVADRVAILSQLESSPMIWLGQPGTSSWKQIVLDDEGLGGDLVASAIASNDDQILVVADYQDEPRTAIWLLDDQGRERERTISTPDDGWSTPALGYPSIEAAWFADRWVVARGSRTAVSFDGTEWDHGLIALRGWVTSLAAGPDGIVATTCGGYAHPVYHSEDGLSWAKRPSEVFGWHSGVDYSDEVGFVISDRNTLWSSPNGQTWSPIQQARDEGSDDWDIAASGNTVLVALEDGAQLLTFD